MTVRQLTELTSAELREAAAGSIALLPIGSQEQHGAHLPMGTDQMTVEAVVGRALGHLADRGPDIVLLPALPYGLSPHHAFSAAITLTSQTLVTLLGEIIDSLVSVGFLRVVVVNGHGGNDEAMRTAVKNAALRADIAAGACNYWDVAAPDEAAAAAGYGSFPGHAGWFETSLMLAARPDRVRERTWAGPADPPPLFDQPPYPGLVVERHGEWERVGGVTDDPAGASAATGRQLLARHVAGLAQAIAAFDRATAASHGKHSATTPESAEARKATS